MNIIYKDLPDTKNKANMPFEDDLAFELPDGRYLSIFVSSEGGYDYTIYSSDYDELDGGIYDDDSIDIREAILRILEDEFGDIPEITLIEIDFDELMENVN